MSDWDQPKYKFGQRVRYWASKSDEQKNEATMFIVRAIKCDDYGDYHYSGSSEHWKPENSLFLEKPKAQ